MKTILTLGDFRQATNDLPDDAVLNVRSPGNYLTWSVSSVRSSITAFTEPETVFTILEIDVDWQKLAGYAVLRLLDPRAFRACLHEMSSRGLAIDSIERQEMAEIIGEPIPDEDWHLFTKVCMCGDKDEWKEAWNKFVEQRAHDRKMAEMFAALKNEARKPADEETA